MCSGMSGNKYEGTKNVLKGTSAVVGKRWMIAKGLAKRLEVLSRFLDILYKCAEVEK